MIYYRPSLESNVDLSFIQLRSYYDSNLEFQHYNSYTEIPSDLLSSAILLDNYKDRNGVPSTLKRDFIYSDEDTTLKIKETKIKDLFSYNTLQRRTFFYSAVLYGKVTIVKLLINHIQKTKSNELPFLFAEVSRQLQSKCALDIAMENQKEMNTIW